LPILTVSDQIDILQGGQGPYQVRRRYMVEGAAAVAFQDWLPADSKIQAIQAGVEYSSADAPGGQKQVLIEVPPFPEGEVHVATALYLFHLTQPHPQIRLDHRVHLSCEGLPTFYEAQLTLPFVLDRQQWRWSADSEPAGEVHHLDADQRAIAFPRRALSVPNPKISLWVSIEGTYRLPVLQRLGAHYRGTLEGLTIVAVPHLLEDFPDFAHSLVEAGARKEDIYIIGIPYSARQDVIDQLKLADFSEVHLPTEYAGIHAEIEETFAWLAGKKARKTEEGKAFHWLIIEDGGYVVPALHDDYTGQVRAAVDEILPHCIGAVEQTRNGIWMYQEKVPAERRAIPVISVAESRLKLELESFWIGMAVSQNICELVERTKKFSIAEGLQALVIGAGATGCQIAKALQSRGFQVEVFDDSPIARCIAKKHGLKPVAFDVPLNMAVRDRFLVVGATGRKNVIGEAEIRAMADGTVVVNASSKLMEINWSAISELGEPQQQGPAKIIYLPHSRGRGKNILILAEGYPVNFYSGRSVNPRNIELITGCLFRAAIELATDLNRPEHEKIWRPMAIQHEDPQNERRAILDFSTALQDEVAAIWEQFLRDG
jgi:S-adenosylhomocysteine hydrolase